MADDLRPDLTDVPVRRGGPGRTGSDRGQREAAAVRGVRALELRMAGATYRQIADAVGYSDGSVAHRAAQRALAADYERTADLRDEFRALQLARIERLTRSHWPRAIAGDVHATAIVVKLLERTSKLLGLDAPTQIAVTPVQHDRVLTKAWRC